MLNFGASKPRVKGGPGPPEPPPGSAPDVTLHHINIIFARHRFMSISLTQSITEANL